MAGRGVLRYNARVGKYNAKKTLADGIVFASQKEAMVYFDLKYRERHGAIADLELQPEFPIVVNGVKVCTYRADFRYRELHPYPPPQAGFTWEVRVVDAKGFKTPMYRLKKKLVKALYGIEIQEV